MVLKLTPEERRLYTRERNRQRGAAWRQKKAWEAQDREARYQHIEKQCALVAAENTRLETENQRIRQEMLDLQNAPPRERIKEVEVLKEVPTVANVINIGSVLKLCREAPEHWRAELWAELEPLMRPFIK